MLAVLDQEEASGFVTDNTGKYLQLMLLKLLLDASAFYLCSHKLYTYISTACSLSIVAADVVLTCSLAAVWFAGSPAALCFLLSIASATYGALPLPVVILAFLDYYLLNSCPCSHSPSCRPLTNAVLVSLGWLLAFVYSHSCVNTQAMELNHLQTKARICEIQESVPIFLFDATLFTALFCMTMPFLPCVPQWVKEANRLSQVREEHKRHSSDLFIWTYCEKQKEPPLLRRHFECPPLWLSLALGFGTFWIPYLTISAACLLLNVAVPSYITVNVLWLECVNSFLMGFVFWTKSNKEGPYSQLPDNVCSWNVYWHLSNGTGDQGRPIAVFNPSEVKRHSLLLV